MSLTLEDIARLSGSSRSTVSRVINGEAGVSDKTRKKILDVIKQVNFQPNLAARGLAAGRTKVLGLVIPAGVQEMFTVPFYARLIQSVSHACNQLDYSVMLWLAEPEHERRTISKILYNGLVDGVIVASMLTDDLIIQALIESDLPFVLVGRHPTDVTVSFVDVENRKGAFQAVTRLIHYGRKRIATITGPQNMIAGLDRFQGYCDALSEAGWGYDSDLIINGEFNRENGYSGMQKLLRFNPDAVFAASDSIAIGAIQALQEHGRMIPDDVAVIGFDDSPMAISSEPRLTTLRQPVDLLGVKAAELLIQLIEEDQQQPLQVVYPVDFIIRQSCGTQSRDA